MKAQGTVFMWFYTAAIDGTSFFSLFHLLPLKTEKVQVVKDTILAAWLSDKSLDSEDLGFKLAVRLQLSPSLAHSEVCNSAKTL